MEEFEAMFGWGFGDAYDLNHDGVMDDFERIAAFSSFVEMCEADVRAYKSKKGDDLSYIRFMDDDEKIEYLEDLGIDVDGFAWED